MHVLGLPPAFVLSQDQTLKLKTPRVFNPGQRSGITPKSSPKQKHERFLTFEPLHIVICQCTTVLSHTTNPNQPSHAETRSSRPKAGSALKNSGHIKLMKLTAPIIGVDPCLDAKPNPQGTRSNTKTQTPKRPIYEKSVSRQTKLTAHISLQYVPILKERDKTTTLLANQHDRCSFHLGPNTVASGGQ